MNFPLFIAKKISFQNQRAISHLMAKLAIASIALAIIVMEVSLSLVAGFEHAIKEKVVGFVSHIQLGSYGFWENMSAELEPLQDSAGSIPKIQKLPEVKSVSPYIFKWSMLEKGGDLEVLMLKGVNAAYDWDFFRHTLKSGKLPNFEVETQSLEVLISQKQANLLNAKVGDKATLLFIQDPIKRRPVTIAGIYDTGLEEFDRITVFCDIRMLQNVLKWDSTQVMGYEVDLKNAENLEKTASEIHLLANENWEAVPVTKIPAYAPIFDWLKLQHQNVWFILILMMAVAIINMSSVVLILVIERTPTIGVLHALGMRPRNIQSIFVWNMFFLMVIGLVIGNIVGLGLLASQYFFKWLTLDPESYFIDSVPVAWVWTQFFWINLITIVVCSLMMYIPTLIIARINPTKAIRFQ